MRQNHLECLLKQILPESSPAPQFSDLVGVGVGVRIRVSSESPGDADAAGPDHALWILLWRNLYGKANAERKEGCFMS